MDPFLGQIALFPYTFAPYGWIDCSGQILPISQYAALFSLLGTNYGGNGTSNFALPNLQGQVPVNFGQGPGLQNYDIGETGGAAQVSLTTATMGPHTHGLAATTAHGNNNTPSGNILAAPVGGSDLQPIKGEIYNPAATQIQLTPNAVGPAGSSVPHNNLQPYLVLRYCIAIIGVFPTRS